MRGRTGARQEEAGLQEMVKAYLEVLGWTVWEGLKGVKADGPVKIFITDGVPDLYIFKGTRQGPLILHIEMKCPDGAVEPHQHKRHQQLRGAGIPVYIATSLEDVQCILHRHGQLRDRPSRGTVIEGGLGAPWKGSRDRPQKLRDPDDLPDLPPDDLPDL